MDTISIIDKVIAFLVVAVPAGLWILKSTFELGAQRKEYKIRLEAQDKRELGQVDRDERQDRNVSKIKEDVDCLIADHAELTRDLAILQVKQEELDVSADRDRKLAERDRTEIRQDMEKLHKKVDDLPLRVAEIMTSQKLPKRGR